MRKITDNQRSEELPGTFTAVIVRGTTGMDGMAPANPGYIIQFPDGSRAVFDAEHIRAVIIGHGSDSYPSDYECANGDRE